MAPKLESGDGGVLLISRGTSGIITLSVVYTTLGKSIRGNGGPKIEHGCIERFWFIKLLNSEVKTLISIGIGHQEWTRPLFRDSPSVLALDTIYGGRRTEV